MVDDVAGGAGADYKVQSERLKKLWEAYEKQQGELSGMNAKIASLEADLSNRESVVRSLKDVLESRDRRMRELEIDNTGLRNDKSTFDPRIQTLTSDLRIERERFAKLFALAQEVEEELEQAKKEIQIRDEWFRKHVDVFGDVQRAIDEHERMISSVRKREGIAVKPALDRLAEKK
jgi:chromosome segregation ATPase